MILFCDECNQDRGCSYEQTTKEFTKGNEIVLVDLKVVVCGVCGSEVYHEPSDKEQLRLVIEAFKRV